MSRSLTKLTTARLTTARTTTTATGALASALASASASAFAGGALDLYASRHCDADACPAPDFSEARGIEADWTDGKADWVGFPAQLAPDQAPHAGKDEYPADAPRRGCTWPFASDLSAMAKSLPHAQQFFDETGWT
ncbi:hypothetical protein ROLI_020070 [Roseobacter fucihabitans]|uniref:Uncharacterized protein n=1 Tax=Roseobacter fucihabitans TaxID=1537242 RepID=A0ABZ2BU35_9RHOB|nr:hypothetical protein [Roseobacter litoralis]MBC6966577.1 hypothetical protein [Roseobacter litoralis]